MEPSTSLSYEQGQPLKPSSRGGKCCRKMGSIPGRSTGCAMAKLGVTKAQEGGTGCTTPSLWTPCPHAVPTTDLLSYWEWRFQGNGRFRAGPLVYFFLTKGKKKEIGILSLGTRCYSNRASSQLQWQRGWEGISLTQKAVGGAGRGAAWCFSGGYQDLAAPSRAGRGPALSRGGSRVWPMFWLDMQSNASWLPLITPSLNISDHSLAGTLRLAPIPVLRPVPVSGARLPAWVLLEGPQSFAGMIYPQELAVVHAVEGTFRQPHTSLTPLSHLCPALPMPVAFAPGPQPISYHFISSFFFFFSFNGCLAS